MTDTLPPTRVERLRVGDATLEIEQVSGLDDLAQDAVRNQDEPFWAHLWPSARALVEVLGDFEDLEGRRVLDLGCGPGAAGLAAAVRSARVVLADIRPEALTLAARNAERNGLEVETRQVDWSQPPADLGRFDGILAADVLYDDGMLRAVLRFMRAHLEPEGIALLADPNRVMPGGVVGAARLLGLEAQSLTLRAGQSLLGGVTLYRIQPRPRLLG